MFRRLTLLLFCSTCLGALSQDITVKDIWLDYKFYSPSKARVHWYDNKSTLSVEGQILFLKDIFSNEKTELLNFGFLPDSLQLTDYVLSPSKNKVVLRCNSEKLYRRSKKSYVIVYDLEQEKQIYISEKKVFNPTLSPDEELMAYTFNNNLFVVNIQSGEEQVITRDGALNHTINGRTDWVYEEEFGFTKAFVWLPNSKKIAYLKFNEQAVKTYNLQVWGSGLYPELYSYKYPKAGEDNSNVSVWCYDLSTKENRKVVETGKNVEYIPKLLVDDSSPTIYFATQNRLQNHFKLYAFGADEDESRLLYEEKSAKYVENPSFINSKKGKMIIDSYSSGYRHFHEIDIVSGLAKDITPGFYDVKEYLGFDKLNHTHYFSALYDNPHTQTICASTGKKIKKIFKTTRWLNASLSADASSLILEKSSLLSKPESNYFKTKSVKEINSWLKEDQEEIKTKVKFLNIPTSKGYEIPAYVIYPDNFSESKKYPLFLHCYGGPGYQVVSNKWSSFDFQYHRMLANKGCVVVVADGRGTDGKGAHYRQSTYGKLGDLEHQDQVRVAEYFRNKEFIDSTKVGVWGWSFGGYLSSLCLLKSPDVFSMAIAVAPVTNWRYYDNIYTERYMGLPKDNPAGYDSNSPTQYAKNLKGEYLLIHGTGDDNVHVQNAILLQNELIKHNKQFDTFYYPDKDHGIYGGTTRFNLYQKMTIFIEKNLLADGN